MILKFTLNQLSPTLFYCFVYFVKKCVNVVVLVPCLVLVDKKRLFSVFLDAMSGEDMYIEDLLLVVSL